MRGSCKQQPDHELPALDKLEAVQAAVQAAEGDGVTLAGAVLGRPGP